MSLKQLEVIFVKAFSRTKSLLFPFSLKKWVLLTFIAIMAGAIGGGGSFNYGPGDVGGHGGTAVQQDEGGAFEQGVGNSGESSGCDVPPDNMPSAGVVTAVVFIIIILLFVPLWLLFLWLHARFCFIFYNTAVFNTVAIRAPWGLYKTLGNSLFWGKLALGVLFIVLGSLLGVGFYLVISNGSWGALWLLVPFALFLLLASVILFHYIDQFIVPIMAMEQLGFKASLHKFLAIFDGAKKPFIVYPFVAMGIGLACGVMYVMLAILIVLLALIVGLVLFGGAYAIFGTDLIFILICVGLGIPFLILLFILLLFVGVPFSYFFRNFTLYYLMQTPCDYDFFGDRNEVEMTTGVTGVTGVTGATQVEPSGLPPNLPPNLPS